MLTGCQTVPDTQTMPSIPADFPSKCKELILLEGNKVALSKLMETVATNYGIYHECALHYENLHSWYTKQRDVFNKVSK